MPPRSRIVVASLALTLAWIGPMGVATAAQAGTDAPADILPIAVPFLSHGCDADNGPVPTDVPWPSDELVVVPLCGADPASVGWLDWTPPAGSTAELIGAVDDPITALPVPSWQYVAASGNVASGNLEFSLNERAGVTLQVVIADATCTTLPDDGSTPCSTGPSAGASGWAHASALREFTLAAAHLAGDLTACGAVHAATACLIGTFGAYSPPTPFDDIDGRPLAAHVIWAYQAGITRGCALDLFCPTDPVTRAEMATFLDRMFDPPATTADAFADDDGSTHEDAINRIAAAGITVGCGGNRFCPLASVSREQMASFIARAADLASAAVNPFYDDDFRTHEADINRAAAVGITNGCAAYRFCPLAAVTREQMVTFLHRVLEPADPPPLEAPCDRSYSPALCIPPSPPDLGCDDIPHRDFAVRPPDPHGFDPDGDGIGCASG